MSYKSPGRDRWTVSVVPGKSALSPDRLTLYDKTRFSPRLASSMRDTTTREVPVASRSVRLERPVRIPHPSRSLPAPRFSSRCGLLCAAFAFLSLLLATFGLQGAPEPAPSEHLLSPPARAKLDEFISKLVEAKGKLWKERMAREIKLVSSLGSLPKQNLRVWKKPPRRSRKDACDSGPGKSPPS